MTFAEGIEYPASGIKVIIVGAGFAGLSLGIECIRNGHQVEIFEAAPEFRMLGDFIGLTPNATRVVSKWDSVLAAIKKHCVWSDHMNLHISNGEIVHKQPIILYTDGFPFCNTHRAYIQDAFLQYALKLGIKINFGERITEFFEEGDEVGIISNGIRHTADIVVGADGVNSRGRRFVTKKADAPVSSGFAIYRAWFPVDRLKGNPLLETYASGKDSMNAWIGPDVHGFVTICESMQSVSYVLTHKDDYTVKESWSFPGHVDDILKIIGDWDPVLKEIICATPPDRLIDWKLLWRDPVKKWVSDAGRMAISGDAAHSFLPSSGNGASQAIEDSATIATALRLAGKKDVKLALRAYEALRYERVCLSQRNGFETRHRWHKTDWKAFKADPNSINLPQPDWLYGFDAERYTIDRWAEVVKHLTEGAPFKSTNVPEGHVHQEWSVAGVMEEEKYTAKPLDVKTWGNTKSKRSEVAIHIETLTISDEQEA